MPRNVCIPTLAERHATGRRLRDKVARGVHAEWQAAPGRDALAAIRRANAGRVPKLVPLKMGRMAESPFAFFRGTAGLMSQDLAGRPVTGLEVQLCGDAHVRNLGAYAAPDGRLVFDLNDFDETIPGPWGWDLKRLATSLLLAGREAGAAEKECIAAVAEAAARYREGLDFFSRLKPVELARYEITRHTENEAVTRIFERAERVTPRKTLKQLTRTGEDGWPRFHDEAPVLEHVPERTAREILAALPAYRETLSAGWQLILDAYRPVDVAFKVVGTGSIGTRDYVVLMLGAGVEDPVFIQIKEELPSCHAPFLPKAGRAPAPAHEGRRVACGDTRATHEGRRVAQGQQRLQTAVDPFLGWATIERRQYLVRQLADHKASLSPRDLKGDTLAEYAALCGAVLAKAHARTGPAPEIYGYCGDSAKLDKAIAGFAVRYAAQVARDYKEFRAAIKAGKIKARMENRS